MGTVTIGGNAKGRQVNPTLYAIINAAAARSPYDVQIFSGARSGSSGGSRHNTNNALDIALVDPTTKQVIPNYNSSTGFPIYAEFAKVAREEQMAIAPEMADQFRWGGGFSDKALDLMHFDFKPGGAMAYWTWQDGGKLTAAGMTAIPKYGAGKVYYGGKRYAAPDTTYASLWGRDPITVASSPESAQVIKAAFQGEEPVAPTPQMDVGNIVQARAATDVAPTMATRPPPGTESYTPRTPNVPPLPQIRSPNAGGVVAPPPTMVSTPPPFALRGTASTGQAAGATAEGGPLTIAPTLPQRPAQAIDGLGASMAATMATTSPTLSGGSGGDLGASFRDVLESSQAPVPTPRSRPSIAVEPPPISGGAGGDLITGSAEDLTPLPTPRPTMATTAPIVDARVKDDVYVPPPAPVVAPETPAEDAIPGTWFEPPGGSMAATLPPELDPASMQEQMSVATTPMYTGDTIATEPPPSAVEPRQVWDVGYTGPQSGPGRAPAGPASQPAGITMATTAPPAAQTGGAANWITKALSSILAPNTGGSRGFTDTGGGVNPVTGQPYRSGTGIGGQPALQWTNSRGQTVTVQENTFGQPGYLTGFG